jgi:hypothetical protein
LKILLDEGVPRSLGSFLKDFEIATVQNQGWTGLKNGELLRLAVAANFKIMITLDTNMQYQQNLEKYPINFIVIRGKTNRLEHLQPLFPAIQSIILSGRMGKITHVD